MFAFSLSNLKQRRYCDVDLAKPLYVVQYLVEVVRWVKKDEQKDRLFVERRDQGDYAVRKPDPERVSDVRPTRAEAIDRARELNPGQAPLVERVRYTTGGKPDKLRKP
jgi:uncharacterized protein DUF2188